MFLYALAKLKKNKITPTREEILAVESMVKKINCFVCLLTGHSKSLIFELIPWCCKFLHNVEDETAVYSVVLP
jgi:hypothetical protein